MELKQIALITLIFSIFIFLIAGALIVYKANSVLVTEIVDSDKEKLPVPREGEKIFVYGPWVEDVGHIIPVSWNEIHPIRYLKNINNNREGGEIPYKNDLMNGVHTPSRLIVLDNQSPYRNSTGIVDDIFYEYDGDTHIEIIPDENSKELLKMKKLPQLPIKLRDLRAFTLFLFRIVIPILIIFTVLLYTKDFIIKREFSL